MNTKRQTIWLVSMLSLMVLLSAYYLFTQDLGDADKLTDNRGTGQDVTEVGGGLVINDVTQSGDNDLDRKVLEQIERDGLINTSLFTELMLKRERQYEDEQNRIMAIITDVNNEQEVSAAAFSELELLEDKDERITALENELMKTYEIAVISQDNDHFKVVVASENMERKEAAGIIEQVTSVLEVTPNQVSVQYVPQG